MEVTSGADSGNRLYFPSFLFRIDGTDVFRRGVKIGTITSDGIGTSRLEITFNSNALKGYVQQLVRAIRFRTAGSSLTTDRTISFSLTDGDGGTSATLTRVVAVS